MNDRVVLKFGGTSVSTRERWETIEQIAGSGVERGESPFIVCSAVSGVSNLLEALLDHAVLGEHESKLKAIRETHDALADALGVDLEAHIGEELALIERLAIGASFTQEVSPRLQAMVMACGELMSTKLGVAFLNREGGELKGAVRWEDARDHLRATSVEGNLTRHYLSAMCDFAPRADLQRAVEGFAERVVITQGFIARDEHGHTVLLGRGGSDTSAAYFASMLEAKRLEIWTDVPGMFTANPRQVPSARLLKQLSYNEAQELASMGAKVLHPRCLEPVRRRSIPLHIRCTQRPKLKGTIVSALAAGSGAQVKAISTKSGIPLISMETVGMWQQVGFLADVFQTFKLQGLSIDQVATSETNITVSLDPVANALDGKGMEGLLARLERFCVAKRIGPCAAVSLVGHNIRAVLHKLGPMLEVFEEHHIYMVSQSSSDLNITFVVAESQAERLVRELHAMIFSDITPQSELIGPTWREIFSEQGDVRPHKAAAKYRRSAWWRERAEELIELATARPGGVYVYARDVLEEAVDSLTSLSHVDRLHYAMKANPHEEILSLFASRDVCFECVSPGELERALEFAPSPERVLFTPNFAPIEDYTLGFERGVHLTLDNLHPLREHGELFGGRSIILRLDPGLGKGHHKHVKTAGPKSKFGVSEEDLVEAASLAKALDVTISGLHVHVGSGILKSPETWAENALFMARQAEAHFPDARVLDLGGGLGIPERRGDVPLSLELVDEYLGKFKALYGEKYELWLEPGRFCVAEAGVLLARVTQIKRKGQHAYIGIETGMNSLIRPSLYGAYHQIVNLSRLGERAVWTADIVGPICESGDVLGYARPMPETREGDVLLIATAGAYGRAMSSHYNLRPPASEVVL